MGRAFTVNIPASGGGSVPVNVAGDTYFSGIGDFQVAYDPADFDSNQYTVVSPGVASPVIFCFPPNTILWFRVDPTIGAPAVDLSVWTSIKEVPL